MQFKILADEDVDFRIVTTLRENGHEVISVLREYQGISDEEVITLAKKLNAILLTEDSDFGHWVFALKERDISVLFLRYSCGEQSRIARSLIRIIEEQGASLYGKFVVITVNKIRIRNI